MLYKFMIVKLEIIKVIYLRVQIQFAVQRLSFDTTNQYDVNSKISFAIMLGHLALINV